MRFSRCNEIRDQVLPCVLFVSGKIQLNPSNRGKIIKQIYTIGGSTSLLIRVFSITSCYLKDSNIFENFLKTLWWHFGVSFINFADQMRLLLRFPTPPNQSLEVGQFRTSIHWRSRGGRGANVSLGIERFCKK